MSIDLGSENMKIALVKHGQPFRIVEDETSKRKFPAIVAFDQDQRLFGNAAVLVSGDSHFFALSGV